MGRDAFSVGFVAIAEEADSAGGGVIDGGAVFVSGAGGVVCGAAAGGGWIVCVVGGGDAGFLAWGGTGGGDHGDVAGETVARQVADGHCFIISIRCVGGGCGALVAVEWIGFRGWS